MTEHSITWYESTDGMIFKDEDKCIEYELNLLYKRSGVGFYIGDTRVNWITVDENDSIYNAMTDIFIDRSKTEENEAFYNFVHDYFGWFNQGRKN